MLKNIFYYLFKSIAWLWHCLYSYNVSLKLRRIKDKLYTFWISNDISKFGKSSTIGCGCYLLGGKYIESYSW